jgi:hypothetical protein
MADVSLPKPVLSGCSSQIIFRSDFIRSAALDAFDGNTRANKCVNGEHVRYTGPSTMTERRFRDHLPPSV